MVVFGVVASLVVIMTVLKWWSEGILDGSDALIVAIVLCGLCIGLFSAESLWQFLAAALPFAACIWYLGYSFKWGAAKKFFKQQCKDYMDAIEFDPHNHGAREYLGNALYNLGELDRAIDEMQAAVDMGAGIEAQYKLAKWTKERYLRDCMNPICRRCGIEGSIGAKVCAKCGSNLPYKSALGVWLTRGKTARARYYLLIVFGTAIVAGSLIVFPFEFSLIPIVLFGMALAGWAMVSSGNK